MRAACEQPCAAIESLLATDEYETPFRVSRPNQRILKSVYDSIRETRVILSWRDVLKERERRVFDAHYNEGLSASQIVTRYRVGGRALRYRFQKAMRRIADASMERARG